MATTVIEKAAAAAMRVKDMSPDFDPRDLATIQKECEAMAMAVVQSLEDGLSANAILAGQDAAPGKLTDQEVRKVFGACIAMIQRGQ